VLSRESVEKRGVFNWDTVERLVGHHEASREDYTDHLLALTNFELWNRIYVDGQSPDALEAELVGGLHR